MDEIFEPSTQQESYQNKRLEKHFSYSHTNSGDDRIEVVLDIATDLHVQAVCESGLWYSKIFRRVCYNLAWGSAETVNQTFGFQNPSGVSNLHVCLKFLGVVEDAAESLVRASRLEYLPAFVDGVVPLALL